MHTSEKMVRGYIKCRPKFNRRRKLFQPLDRRTNQTTSSLAVLIYFETCRRVCEQASAMQFNSCICLAGFNQALLFTPLIFIHSISSSASLLSRLNMFLMTVIENTLTAEQVGVTGRAAQHDNINTADGYIKRPTNGGIKRKNSNNRNY